MNRWVVLLRAVNVGGTGKLPMAELRAMCTELGFIDVQTYIASGNVVLRSEAGADEVIERLEARLQVYAGKPVGVLLRSAEEMQQVLDENPYADAAPNQLLVYFFADPPGDDIIAEARHRKDEQLTLIERTLYVHYPNGMGASKMTVPACKVATGRNLNTVAKLVQMATD